MRLLPILAFASACAQPNVPLPEEPTELDRAIVAELEDEAVPGLQAAVFRDGEVVFTGAWGMADTQTRELVDEETLFLVASVSKLITTVAVMQLVEDGRLDLDAPVDGLVGFPVRHPDHPEVAITTRMLLAHVGGIRDDWDVMEPLYTEGDFEGTLGGFLESYLRGEGEYAANGFGAQPVTRYEYSNIGNTLAALVVERVSGEDFAQRTTRTIFEPLGMDDAGWYLRDVDVSRLAIATEWFRGWEPVAHYGFPDYPSGSLRTSADELARFLIAVTRDLLQPAIRDEMLQVQFPELDAAQRLGFFSWELDGEGVLGHDGGEIGCASEVLYRPARDDGVVVLANGDLSFGAFQRIERLLLAL